jgi:uncharacterized protein with beta-barrel porin domain
MKLFRGGILLGLLIAFSFSARAQQDTNWTGNASGAWETGTNWNNGEPTSSTSAGIFPGSSYSTTDNFASGTNGISTYTISLSSNSDAARYLLVSSGFDTTYDILTSPPGVVNLNFGSGAALTLGQFPAAGDPGSLGIGGEATLNVSGGTLNVDNGAAVGVQITISIQGTNPPETFTVSGQGTLGLSGTTLNFTNGLVDGDGPTGAGTITQTNSTVAGDALAIGAEGGTGSYTLNSGSITLSGNGTYGLDIAGQTTGGSGTFTQTGGTMTVDAGVETYIGTYGTGTYTMSGGTATFGGDLYLSDSATGNGTFNQKSGTTMTVDGATYIGDLGSGTYTLSGGTGTFTGTIYDGYSGTSSSTITQTGGTLNANAGMYVGDSATGTFTMSSGTATIEGLTIGESNGITGTFTQTGGNLRVDVDTIIGDSGTGTMTLGGGTATFTSGVTLGNSGGTATLNFSGSNATFDSGIVVDASGTITQTGGTATVTGGIDLTATGSSYNLNGGTLNVDTLTGAPGDGTFNFGGGTLQASTVGALTDDLNGTVTGNSTLDATNNNITLGAAAAGPTINGAGGFTVIGGNDVTMYLSADGTTNVSYTGATVINGGNLVLAGPDGTDVFDSAISGTSGTLGISPVSTTSTVRLPGTLDFTGTTTLNNTSFLDVYNGTLGDVDGTNGNLIVGQDGTQGTYGGGAYAYPTSGTVYLTGSSNTYSGSTYIYNGFGLYASNLSTSGMTNYGTFGNNGAVGTTINIATSYDQPETASTATEGTLAVRVSGNTADKLTAATANMYGTVGVTGYSAIGTNYYDVVSTGAGGLSTGTLNSATASGLATDVKNSTLLTAELSFSNAAIVTTPTVGQDNLYLVVTQLPLSEFALTPNQIAVANALDAGLASPSSNDALFGVLNNLSTGEIPDALDQLSPRAYLYMRDLAFDNATFLAENMHSRMEAMREGFSGVDTSGLSIVAPGMESTLGRSLGSMLAYNGEGVAPNGVNYYPQDETAQPYAPPAGSLTTPEESSRTISDSPNGNMAPTSATPSSSVFNSPNFSEFISGDLILADLKQDQSNNNIPEAHYTAADATAGVGFKITPQLTGGVLFDYNHTDARTDNQGSHVRVDTYSPGAFATLSEGGLYVDGLFTFGYNDYSNDRKINISGAGATATSSPSGEQYVGDLDLGYNFHPDKEGHWALGPEVGLEYVHLDVDSFTESGAGPADLSVNSQSADSLRSRLGGRLSYFTRSGSIVFAPTVFASYQHEFLNDPFGLIGVGVSATFDNAMSIYLNYLAEVGADDYFVQSVQGGLKASF